MLRIEIQTLASYNQLSGPSQGEENSQYKTLTNSLLEVSKSINLAHHTVDMGSDNFEIEQRT